MDEQQLKSYIFGIKLCREFTDSSGRSTVSIPRSLASLDDMKVIRRDKFIYIDSKDLMVSDIDKIYALAGLMDAGVIYKPSRYGLYFNFSNELNCEVARSLIDELFNVTGVIAVNKHKDRNYYRLNYNSLKIYNMIMNLNDTNNFFEIMKTDNLLNRLWNDWKDKIKDTEKDRKAYNNMLLLTDLKNRKKEGSTGAADVAMLKAAQDESEKQPSSLEDGRAEVAGASPQENERSEFSHERSELSHSSRNESISYGLINREEPVNLTERDEGTVLNEFPTKIVNLAEAGGSGGSNGSELEVMRVVKNSKQQRSPKRNANDGSLEVSKADPLYDFKARWAVKNVESGALQTDGSVGDYGIYMKMRDEYRNEKVIELQKLGLSEDQYERKTADMYDLRKNPAGIGVLPKRVIDNDESI